jgi:hypothetical protein
MRDLMESTRASGVDRGGQSPPAQADQPDRLLARHG